MGLLIKSTETAKVTVANSSIELPQVYGRVRFMCQANGVDVEFETRTYESEEKYIENDKAELATNISGIAMRFMLKEDEKQDVDTVLSYAKSFFEAQGFECEVV